MMVVCSQSDERRAAVAAQLEERYSATYEVVSVATSSEGADALVAASRDDRQVAILLADDAGELDDGHTVFQVAARLFPDARRGLLVEWGAWGDRDTADLVLTLMGRGQIDYYVIRPWHSPDEYFHRTITEFLSEWDRAVGLRPREVSVLGDPESPRSHEIKDFLARNQVPYQWLDIESSEEAQQLVEFAACDRLQLPLVLFSDGSSLLQPTSLQVAEKIGLQTKAGNPFYDLIIVGGGPAGLAAAVYGASEGLDTVIIEREAPGGQAGTSSRIENYLGFPVGLSGADLARRAVTQARRFGVEILTPQEVKGIRVEDPYRFVQLADGSEISCHSLILALGVSWKRLDVPGLEKLTGAGVYYGAAQTEAISCQGEEVYIIGGANSAGQAAMYFSKYASKVTILVRGESLTKSMSQYLIDQINETPNIKVIVHSSVIEAKGETSLEAISIANSQTGETETVGATSLFIFIGAVPRTDWLEGVLERDNRGFILTGQDLKPNGTRPKGWTLERDPFLLETNIPGIFAVGDVRHNSIKRVASGVGEGSICVQFVHQYLSKVL